MYQKIKDFIYKVTRSSQDPNKISLMIVGVITGVATTAVKFAPVVCSLHLVCVDPNVIVPFADSLISIVENILGGVAMIMIAIGGIRKIINGSWTHPDAGVQ